MGNVGERPAMDERRRALQRLYEVGRQRLLQERRHRAMRLEIAGMKRRALARIGGDDVSQPRLEVFEIAREAEDGHHLGGDGDVETGFARIPVADAAERTDDLAQRTIVDVHHVAPHHAPPVEPQFVAPIEMVVDQRGEQIVGRGDGVQVAGEMKIDVLHRHDLGITAARRAALHAEGRTEARFAQTQHRALAELIERVGEADRRRRLALARGGRRHGGNQHELAVRPVLQRADIVERDLRLVVPVRLEVLRRDAELFARHLDNRALLRSLRDFDVGFRIDVLCGRHRARPFWPSFRTFPAPVLPCPALRINRSASRRHRAARAGVFHRFPNTGEYPNRAGRNSQFPYLAGLQHPKNVASDACGATGGR